MAGKPVVIWTTMAMTIVVVDQASKELAFRILDSGEGHIVVRPQINEGLAFGVSLFQREAVAFMMAAGLIFVCVHAGIMTARRRLAPHVTALIAGGALSNLLDRISVGGVRDWLPVWSMVLNLADIAILVGLMCYLHRALRRERSACVSKPL